MQEITIRYTDPKVLLLLRDFAKHFDFVIEEHRLKKEPKISKHSDVKEREEPLPIEYSANPDITALAGIWKGKEISLETLRKKAWGDRL